ncbi:MAG TPA: nucleotidyltransferase family protein [Candidatus Binataceae bacterium]|nr:nucleotidyltransferase family protein [Candidatus Binataceae bacterium]
MTGPRVEAILLAAGESRRMGRPKPLIEVAGRTFIATISDAILTAVPRLIIVIGADADRIRAAIPADQRVAIVENSEYRRGQLSSLKAGLAEVSPDTDAALVHLCDHPVVRPETFRTVIDAYGRSGGPIVIARYHGRRGHPVIFDRSLFGELIAASEGQGARQVVDADSARVHYADVDDPGVVLDLDSPADLERSGIITGSHR